MEYRYEVTGEDERFIYSKTYVRMSKDSPWEYQCESMRSKTTLWFTKSPHEILADFGIKTEKKRAEELSDLINGDINGWYYVAAASDGTDEAIKWIMGPLAAKLNEIEGGGAFPKDADMYMPADYLKTFVEYLKAGKFEKSFAKDIFAELMRQSFGRNRHDWDGDGVYHHYYIDPETHRMVPTHSFTWEDFQALQITPLTPEQWENEGGDPNKYDPTCTYDIGWDQSENFKGRFTGPQMMDTIIADPRFKAAGGEEIDAIIEEVIAANPDNAGKVQEQPKLVQWFVGQVMKAAKGKAPAPVVLDKLKARFGVEL